MAARRIKLSKVVKNNKEVDLKNYIIESMTKTDSLNIRQVENTIDYIARRNHPAAVGDVSSTNLRAGDRNIGQRPP